MNSKKKKRPAAAQQLIDSLLDERTPTATPNGPTRTSSTKPERSLRSVDPTRMQPNERLDEQLDQLTREVEEPRQTRSLREENIIDVPESHSHSEHEKTLRLEIKPATNLTPEEPRDFSDETHPHVPRQEKSEVASTIDRVAITELRTVVRMQSERQANASPRPEKSGRNGAFASGMSSSEAHLRQSENLRLAQSRITELEQELEKFRRENEQLASAGETLSRRVDELTSKSENLEIQSRETERIRDEERKVFRGQLQHKERENGEMRVRLDEMEGRLENNFKKIRVRERELEHRLEIVRMESATLVSTKDKMILDLKRQIDQLTHENDYSKQKTQELYNQNKDKQETARRVVRALRIALTILEGEEDGSGSGD